MIFWEKWRIFIFFICVEIFYDKEEKEGKVVGIYVEYVMN